MIDIAEETLRAVSGLSCGELLFYISYYLLWLQMGMKASVERNVSDHIVQTQEAGTHSII